MGVKHFVSVNALPTSSNSVLLQYCPEHHINHWKVRRDLFEWTPSFICIYNWFRSSNFFLFRFFREFTAGLLLPRSVPDILNSYIEQRKFPCLFQLPVSPPPQAATVYSPVSPSAHSISVSSDSNSLQRCLRDAPFHILVSLLPQAPSVGSPDFPEGSVFCSQCPCRLKL